MKEFPNYFKPKLVPWGQGASPEERVFVTGGSGFIGTNLVEFYRAIPGFKTLNVDVAAPRNLAHTALHQSVDITNFREIAAVLGDFRPTVIYHLAARTDLDGPTIEDYLANTVGVENLIRAIGELDSKPRATLFASSRLVCKIGYTPLHDEDYCPTTSYGSSKVRSEEIVRTMANNFNWMMFRPTSIWGPWFSVPYRNFFDSIQKGHYLHPRSREIRKSFGFVGNTVYQLDRLAYANFENCRNRTIYLCDYEPLDVYQWAVIVARSFGRSAPRQVPEFALQMMARLGDLVEAISDRHAPLTSFRLENLLTNMVHDTAALRAAVGELPFSVEEGVSITTRWLTASQR
jgi:nucleoside-diphosphate-sugar epimerase